MESAPSPQQPAHKKQKFDDDAAPLAPVGALRVVSLLRSRINLPAPPSPGPLHGCRVAAHLLPSGCVKAYVATSASVYSVEVPASATQAAAVGLGKEGVRLAHDGGPSTPHRLDSHAHRGEVQSLALQQYADSAAVLASVDCYGHATLSAADTGRGSGATVSSSLEVGGPSRRLAPSAVPEAGWCGVALPHQRPSHAAVARYFPQDITVYDVSTGQRLGVWRSLQCPTALMYLPMGSTTLAGGGEHLLAVAEEHCVSLWDVRCGGSSGGSGKGGCVERVYTSSGGSSQHALAWCTAQGGLLATTGTERCVALIDPRKWRVVQKWPNCLRQAAHYLAFSSLQPKYCFVSGFDNECVCDVWDAPGSAKRAAGATWAGPAPGGEDGGGEGAFSRSSSALAFRGDGRWLGMCRADWPCTAPGAAQQQDVAVGFSAPGSLFVSSVALAADVGDE